MFRLKRSKTQGNHQGGVSVGQHHPSVNSDSAWCFSGGCTINMAFSIKMGALVNHFLHNHITRYWHMIKIGIEALHNYKTTFFITLDIPDSIWIYCSISTKGVIHLKARTINPNKN